MRWKTLRERSDGDLWNSRPRRIEQHQHAGDADRHRSQPPRDRVRSASRRRRARAVLGLRLERRPPVRRGVVVEDLLPAGVELVSATPSAGTCEPPADRRLTCAIGELAPLDDVEIEIVVSGTTAGLLTNLASVVAAAPADPELSNNQDSHTAVVGDPPHADVAVYKDAPAFASVGEDFAFAVAVENAGPDIAHDVRVTDRLPVSVAFVAATVEGGQPCAHVSGTVTCDLGDIAVDQPVDITITARPQSSGRVVNTVDVAAQGGPADPDLESNSSVVETAVGVPPTANGDAFEIDEDEVLSVGAPGLLVNDTDPDSTALNTRLVSGTRHGWLTLRTRRILPLSAAAELLGERQLRLPRGRRRSDLAADRGDDHCRGRRRSSDGGERRLPPRRRRDAVCVAGRRRAGERH